MQNHKAWQEFNGLVMGVMRFIYPYVCRWGREHHEQNCSYCDADRVASWSLTLMLFWCCFPSFSPYICIYACAWWKWATCIFSIFPPNKELSLHASIIIIIIIIIIINFTATDFMKGNPVLPFVAMSGWIKPCHCDLNHFFFLPMDLTESPSRSQHHPLSTKLKNRRREGSWKLPGSCLWQAVPGAAVCVMLQVSLGTPPQCPCPPGQGLVVAVTWPRAETSSRGVKNNHLWLKLWKERI